MVDNGAMKGTVIIGGGPAGLTAAYELARSGHEAVVLEKDHIVGGISRTVEQDGYRFDIGGHRFFTKVSIVQELWEEILDEEFLVRPRLSRIFYNGKFFNYPLKPTNALRGLGPIEAFRIGVSYLRAQAVPNTEEKNFEQWVSNRFGKRLFEIFFKTYTEKVWGMPCSQISADWAAQRIKNLDLIAALKNAMIGSSTRNSEIVSTLIDQFHYPRHGPGMMWECCQEKLEGLGVHTELGSEVERFHLRDGKVVGVDVRRATGSTERLAGKSYISSMPLNQLVLSINPPPPPEVIEAARSLRYRDFLIVVLAIAREDVFPDNWIYIHSPDVRVGRVQNFKNWSPDMVPSSRVTSLGLEYFVQENDDLWSRADPDLIELGAQEMEALGLIDPAEVIQGWVVRMPKAYPVYDEVYQESVGRIRRYIDSIPNLQTVGRNGQHRYNNQDHSMLTGILAARNVLGQNHDVWEVNVEQEYHEEVQKKPVTDRLVPERVSGPTVEELVLSAFARYDSVALGVAVGTVGGLLLFLSTVILLLGPEPRGPHLSQLGNYLLGYDVSWLGAFVGLAESALIGYVLGYVMAKAVNLLVSSYEGSIRRQLLLARTLDPLEATD